MTYSQASELETLQPCPSICVLWSSPLIFHKGLCRCFLQREGLSWLSLACGSPEEGVELKERKELLLLARKEEVVVVVVVAVVVVVVMRLAIVFRKRSRSRKNSRSSMCSSDKM